MTERASPKSLSRPELFDLVWSAPLGAVAARLGMSANGVAKLCDRLAIPRPDRSYWTKAGRGRHPDRPALPPPPAAASTDQIVVGAEGFTARRARTRLNPEDRRDQLMDRAEEILVAEGLAEVSLKRVARDVGISEAQAHNCFAGRIDLLVSLARRELDALELRRKRQIARGGDNLTRIVLSTIGYLHESAERGPALQILLRDPEVSAALRDERQEAADATLAPMLEAMEERYSMSRPVALGSTLMLTALCRRAGALLASGRTSLEVAERLCLPIVVAAVRSNARAAKASSEAR
jgi:AcrR family transcriptional regulator